MENRGWKAVWRRATAHPAVACVVFIAATAVSFWPVTQAGYLNYDDPEYVTENFHVQAGLSWQGVLWALRTYYASNWHPVTWLSHMLDVELLGRGAAGPHCVNLLLHATNSVLLFVWLRRMSGAQWRSYVVAVLFALHPLHVESVAWVSERKDVLSTLFWMLTLLTYGRYVEQSKLQIPKSRVWYAVALFCFTLGLMSKPMLVTLPFVMLLLDYWPLQRFGPATAQCRRSALCRLVREKTPFFVLSGLSCLVTVLAQRKAMPSLAGLPFGDRAANAFISYARYLGKTFWPAGLAVPYPHPGGWDEVQVALAVLLVVGLCAGACWAGRRWPFLFTGWFWYLGTLVPVIGVVQVGSQAMADRYTYVSLVGVFIIVVWGAEAVRCGWRVPKAAGGLAAVLVIAACSILTWQQAGYWQDNGRLFRHAAAVTRGNYTAVVNIGVSLFDDGKLDEAIQYFRQALEIKADYVDALSDLGAALERKGSSESLDYYHQALRIDPRHSAALYNLGNALVTREEYAKAVECFEKSLQVKPNQLEARNNLANALATLGRLDEAVVQYRRAWALKPYDVKVLKNLAAALVKEQKLDEGVVYYRQALKLRPKDAEANYALGLALALQAKWEEASQHYRLALRSAPSNPEAQYNLGYALRMQGQLEQAAIHLREALRLKPEFPWAHYNLGCVLADQGQEEEAVAHLKEALRIKPGYDEAQQKLRALETTTGKEQ